MTPLILISPKFKKTRKEANFGKPEFLTLAGRFRGSIV